MYDGTIVMVVCLAKHCLDCVCCLLLYNLCLLKVTSEYLTAILADLGVLVLLLLFLLPAFVCLCVNFACSKLAQKLNMTPEKAEQWIVDLIRNANLNAKIDSEKVSSCFYLEYCVSLLLMDLVFFICLIRNTWVPCVSVSVF